MWNFGESADETTNPAQLHAERAASFGAHAAAYAEHRPDYPAAGIRWALEPITTAAPVILNTDDFDVEWVAELHKVTRTAASFPQPELISAQLPAHPLFEDFERAEFPHRQRRTAESLTATIGTHSHTLVIPAQARSELLERITDYLRSRPETTAGEFDLPIRTEVIRAVRHPADSPTPQSN